VFGTDLVKENFLGKADLVMYFQPSKKIFSFFFIRDKITNQIVGLKLMQKTLIQRHSLTDLLA